MNVAIRFSAGTAPLIRSRLWRSDQTVEELPDGGLILRMPVDGPNAVRRWVLSFGSGAEVLEPDGLRETMRRELTRGAGDAETHVTNDELVVRGKIAWTRLKELPDYYTRLAWLEAVADDDGMALAAPGRSSETAPDSTGTRVIAVHRDRSQT